jgi:hypothetical protein
MAALTDKEAELYDRQIRLWGVEAQQRLRGASVFIVGLSALGAEITKNLVLAGFSVTLLDAAPATPRDLGAQFFLDASSVGVNRALASQARAQDLNKLVRVEARGCGAGGLGDAELGARPVVVLCDLPSAEVVATCARCRAVGAPVLAANSYGLWGTLFQDAGEGYAFERAAGGARVDTGAGASEAAAAAAPPLETVAFKPLAEVLQGATYAALARIKRVQQQPMAFAWVGAWLQGKKAPHTPKPSSPVTLTITHTSPPPPPLPSLLPPLPQNPPLQRSCTRRARRAGSRPRRRWRPPQRRCAAMRDCPQRGAWTPLPSLRWWLGARRSCRPWPP